MSSGGTEEKQVRDCLSSGGAQETQELSQHSSHVQPTLLFKVLIQRQPRSSVSLTSKLEEI